MIDSLNDLANLKYMRAQSKLGKWVAREALLREKLAGLKDREVEPQTITAHQLSGTDVQWYRWLESRQIAINTELSRCMVQKEAARKVVETEFGRCQSSEVITKGVKAQSISDDRKKEDQTMHSFMIYTCFRVK